MEMKRGFSVLLAILMAVALIGTAYAGGAKEGAKTAQKVKITYWFFPIVKSVAGMESTIKDFGDWEKYLATEYMKTNPNVDVVTELQAYEGGVDKVNVAIAGGNPPEIIFDYLGRTSGWYLQGAAQPLDNIISDKLKADILDNFKSLYTINGKLHGVPGFAWNIGLDVNRGLLKSWGYTGDILNGPGNAYSLAQFEEFLAKVKKVAPAGSYPFAIACGSEQGDYTWWQFFWGQGATLFNADGTTASDLPGMVEGYAWIKSMMDKGYFAPGIATMNATDVVNMWNSGKIALIGGHKGSATTMKKSIDDGLVKFDYDVTIVPFPTKDGKSAFAAMGPTGFIILAKDAAKQKAAASFIEFQVQPKYWINQIMAPGQFPALKSVAALDPFKNDPFNAVQSQMLAKFPAGDFALTDPNYNKIRIAMSAAGQAVFSGLKSPKDAVAGYLAEVKKIRGK
jgi:multiple sugar transport system substrate-binding protein